VKANPLRGEVDIDLADGPCRLRPSFAALVAAEAELGSLFALLDRAGAGDIRLSDMTALCWHCCAASGVDRRQFEDAVLRAGVARILPGYRALLQAVFGGG
jgi:hypothetical protein